VEPEGGKTANAAFPPSDIRTPGIASGLLDLFVTAVLDGRLRTGGRLDAFDSD